MEMLAEHFSLGVTTTTTLVMRMLMVPLLLYNMFWSFKGFWQFVKGIAYPGSLYSAVVFLGAVALMMGHMLAFTGKAVYDQSSIYILLIQCIWFAAVLTTIYGKTVTIRTKADDFFWLFNNNNLDLALRTAHLAEFDRSFTQDVIDSAENTAAMKLVSKALRNELG
jgi:hypothetical protein